MTTMRRLIERADASEAIRAWLDGLGDPITVYRAVVVPDPQHIDWSRLGRSFTADRRRAHSPFGRVDGKSGREVVVEAVVTRSDVDEMETVSTMRRYPEEREVRVRDGASVQVRGVWDGKDFHAVHRKVLVRAYQEDATTRNDTLSERKEGQDAMTTMRTLIGRLEEATMKRQGQILPTEQRDYGYFGRIKFRFENADEIWAETFRMIMSEMPDVSSAAIRNYMDSKSGANFGDLVAVELKDTLPTPDSALYGRVFNPRMADVKRIVASLFGKLAWVRQHIEAYAKDQEAATSGTMSDIGRWVIAVVDDFELAQDQEKKKNWKQRDAALHSLQKAADQLLTTSRAWMAQRR